MSKWNLFFAALGLAMALEGLPYLISPAGVRRYLHSIELMRDGVLRTMGLVLIVLGLFVAYVSTR